MNTWNSELDQARYDAMVGHFNASQQSADAAQLRYAEAMRIGDMHTAAEAQRTMSREEARMVNFQSGIDAYDQARDNQQPQEATQQQARWPTPQEIISYWQQRGDINAREANILRHNPDYVTDPQKFQAMQQASAEGVAKGYDRGSSRHLGFMCERLGILPPLTPEQKQAAKDSNVDEDTYARGEIKRLQVEHLYQRSNG
jgi:hypothetical protein